MVERESKNEVSYFWWKFCSRKIKSKSEVKVGDIGREVIHRLVETRTKCEMSNGDGEIRHWTVEIPCEGEVGEVGREVV